MFINPDFSLCAIVTPSQYKWVAAPQDGVERVMLDRIGAEKARATSLVRYAPGAIYPQHVHPGGEEILVLSGTFSEGEAHYPAGWYLRNPPGSSHRPDSGEGALIFVKLWQMPPGETRRVRIDTRDPSNWRREGNREICLLFSDANEHACLQRLAPGQSLFIAAEGGTELLVLTGEVMAGGRAYAQGTWMRLPAGVDLGIVAGASGTAVYLKTGHLASEAQPC